MLIGCGVRSTVTASEIHVSMVPNHHRISNRLKFHVGLLADLYNTLLSKILEVYLQHKDQRSHDTLAVHMTHDFNPLQPSGLALNDSNSRNNSVGLPEKTTVESRRSRQSRNVVDFRVKGSDARLHGVTLYL